MEHAPGLEKLTPEQSKWWQRFGKIMTEIPEGIEVLMMASEQHPPSFFLTPAGVLDVDAQIDGFQVSRAFKQI